MERVKIKKFLQEEQGTVAVEYVIIVAFACVLLGAAVFALFQAMGELFGHWATYFGAEG